MSYTIQIIDDDEDIRFILKRIFSSVEGLQILEAPNGSTALEQFKNHHIDGVILDYRLPDMHGDDLLLELQQVSSGQAVKIIMLSARDDPALHQKWLNMGAVAVLKKPFNPIELFAQVKTYLEI